ncbi:hypothetical protein AX17_001576 [Amanita inopinata Kibby_2008]|nr:hypothetical protein AX17_001576 [Amanita inopinata Kibby_2008]
MGLQQLHLKITFSLLRHLLPRSFRSRLYNHLWNFGLKLYGPTDFFVQRLPFLNVYMKRGPKAPQEAQAIRFVREHTDSIPIPTVLDVGEGFFVMTGLEGEPLGNVFADLKEEEMVALVDELRGMLRELRCMPYPEEDAGGGGSRGGGGGGGRDEEEGRGRREGERERERERERKVSGPLLRMPCCDVNRIDLLEFGPFATVQEFEKYLISRAYPNMPHHQRPHLKHKHTGTRSISSHPNPGSANSNSNSNHDSIRTQNQNRNQKPKRKRHRILFTHGDLNLRNILIHKGKITGIVDWTCAGWYPEYWDLTKAIYAHPRLKKWLKFWEEVLPGYGGELERERLLWGGAV